MAFLTCIALGGMTGIALGLTGAGGGILAIPLLMFGLGLTQAQAAPIALIAIALAAALGAILGLREGVVRYRAAALIGGVGMLAAPVGVWLAGRTPPAVLTVGLAGVMALSATTLYRRSRASPTSTVARVQQPCRLDPTTGRFAWTRLCTAVLAGIGLATGALSGLLGVGGGFLLVPAFTQLTNLQVSAIVSTSQAVIALVSAAGAVAAMAQRDLEWTVALPFTAAAMGALLVARALSRRLPPRAVQRSFALLCAGIAAVLFATVVHAGLPV